MGIHGTRNLFENNEQPEKNKSRTESTIDESKTTPVRILHNGNQIGTGEVSIYGDVVSVNLNADGAELLRSRVVLQVADL